MQHFAAEGRSALDILEAQLVRNGVDGWAATGSHPSIADVALYPYTRMATMGGIDMTPYLAIGTWLERIEAMPGYQPLFPGRPDLTFSTAEIFAATD
jgi:glutathione S-transferase